jgi:hypothetical protein
MKSTIRLTVARRPRLVSRNVLSLLAGMTVLATATLAKAKEIGVYVEGPRAKEVREALVDDAPDGVTVAEAQAFHGALAAQGQTTPFGRALDSEGNGHDASIKRVRGAASSIGLAAVLVSQIAKRGGKWRVRLWVVSPSGEEQGPEDVTLDAGADPRGDPELKNTAAEMLAAYKGAASSAESASPVESPAPAESPAPPASEPPASTTSDSAAPGKDYATSKRPRGLLTRSVLEVEVGGGAAGRQFSFNDGITSNLRSYGVGPAALASVGFEFFPWAEDKGLIRDIGLIGSFSRSLFLASSLGGDAGVSIRTVESAIAGGVRFRIHPWGDEGAIIGVSDEYTSQAVTFDSTGVSAVDDQVPATNYQANRTGVDARIPFGRFALRAGAGFRAVLNAGATAQRFRSPSVEGVDAQFGLSMTVVTGWEARLVGDYERYFYSFGPVPGDGYVAGGALDEFYGATLAVAYIF